MFLEVDDIDDLYLVPTEGISSIRFDVDNDVYRISLFKALTFSAKTCRFLGADDKINNDLNNALIELKAKAKTRNKGLAEGKVEYVKQAVVDFITDSAKNM